MASRVSSRRLTHFLIAAAVTLSIPATSQAGKGLDVRGWLDRPGTLLVVVEFYATWCEPCMKAVPRWKSLHETYRSKGLRLVVVSTLDPEGQCVNPGWNPDEMVRAHGRVTTKVTGCLFPVDLRRSDCMAWRGMGRTGDT